MIQALKRKENRRNDNIVKRRKQMLPKTKDRSEANVQIMHNEHKLFINQTGEEFTAKAWYTPVIKLVFNKTKR